MSDNTKMLQALVDGQSKINKKLDVLGEKIDENGKRINKLGLDLAELSDDASTVDEFEELDKRVAKIENVVFASN